VLALLAWAAPAAAHGFGQRFDLPLPLWLWVTGAGATIVLSFAIVALFVRESPPVDTRARLALRIPGLGWIAGAARAVSVALFLIALLAGFFGAQDPYRNIIVTMVWVAWWVGFAFACALIGNLWRPLNPLAVLFGWAERATRGRLSLRLRYPPSLGVWPAVVLFFCFAWAELVWRDKDVPVYLARTVLVYSVLAWAGMLAFGREAWLERGEAFSLAFGILGRFGPVDTREGALRFPGAGLAEAVRVPFSFVVFVLLMLATVTFDGFLETPLHQALATRVQSSPALARLLFRLSEFGVDEDAIISTVALIAFPLLFLAAYWLASWAMVAMTGKSTVIEVACAFVLTLVPIAVAYHLSHYFSLLVTAGQFIIPLASDPFGYGWNLFGTAGYKVNLAIASPYVFWYGAVTLVVVGHVIAVYLAHAVALREFGSRRLALLSQVPMLALMVGYTMLSLWILAQPIVG
jgi:hypothetical protein